jgi:D-alanyl-lipoteichoic acid acyltransferase DltB (MBOAT superfamily)
MPDKLFYIENQPLIFTDAFFWLLFGMMLVFYQFFYHHIRVRNMGLLAFSFYFYYLSSGWYVSLLLVSTVIDYYIGKKIFETEKPSLRKMLVRTSVFANLLILAYFKYTFFLADTYNSLIADFLGLDSYFEKKDYLTLIVNEIFASKFDTKNIFLPVGISFFTFQTISYSVDIYRRRIEPVHDIFDFAFFVSFFPQLVAGPIVRANEFVEQIYKKFELTNENYQRAIFLILIGLVKKIFISDYISVNYVERVFGDAMRYSGFEVLMGIYGYALQIYCDFSGYTDIAIGIALLLGFELPKNFDSPYKSLSITDFWRRWHISLSTWLKDYLYIPLGGNRGGRFRTYINLFLTMLLGGLWHGAAWRFVIWGALHGGALAIHKFYTNNGIDKKMPAFIRSDLFTGFLTFHFVCFCWIFFRASDTESAIMMILQIFDNFGFELIGENIFAYAKIYGMIVFGYAIHWLPECWEKKLAEILYDIPDFAKAFIIVLIVLIIYQVKSADLQPFIYFQF